MASLRDQMAVAGFESNDSYDFHLRSLLSYQADVLRALNIDGDPGRRKTAFANALAQALQYPHVLYFDFSNGLEQSATKTTADTGDSIGTFDRLMSDACAFSEGDKTIVILDQLQAADFREHIRIYKFIKSREWSYKDASFIANEKNLLLFLISEETLYHSLQKSSLRVWVSAASLGDSRFMPGDFGLPETARDMMLQLGALFTQLGVQPTRSEYRHLLHDIQHNIRTPEDLAQAIYGWTEGIERTALLAAPIQNKLTEVMSEIQEFLGVDHLEISSE